MADHMPPVTVKHGSHSATDAIEGIVEVLTMLANVMLIRDPDALGELETSLALLMEKSNGRQFECLECRQKAARHMRTFLEWFKDCPAELQAPRFEVIAGGKADGSSAA